MSTPQLPHKRRFLTAAMGTAVAALCCFTPILAVIFGAIGLGVINRHLDYILLPALVLMIVLSVISYRKWKQAEH